MSSFIKVVQFEHPVAVGNSIFSVIHWHQEAAFPLQE